MNSIDFYSRLIIICGHYGSGKTNVAVNLALLQKERGFDVTLVDMDIVNPYFRSADSSELLEQNGINVIAPEFANTNVDIPSLPAEIYSIFSRLEKGEYVILDVGGDSLGAAALGFINRQILNFGYDMLYVFNAYRPITPTAEEAYEILKEIQERSRLNATALVNNSNIGSLTEKDDIYSTFEYQDSLSEISSLKTRFLSTMIKLDSEIKTPVLFMQNVTKHIF